MISSEIPPNFDANAAVTKPSFLNRRENVSHLKKSFPAGFQTHKARRLIAGDVPTYELNDYPVANEPPMIVPIHGRGKNNRVPATIPGPTHYTTWTLGAATAQEEESTFDLSNADADPYGEVAGMYYAQINHSNSKNVHMKKINLLAEVTGPSGTGPASGYGDVVLGDVATADAEDPTANKTRKSIRGTSSKQPKMAYRQPSVVPIGKIYHAPSSLPNFSPSLPTTRPINHLLEASTTSYAHLTNKNPEVQQERWQVRGNDISHNYSAHGFKGDTLRRTLLQGFTGTNGSNSRCGVFVPMPFSPSHESAMTDSMSRSSPNLGGIRPLSPATVEAAMSAHALVHHPLPKQLVVEVFTVNQLITSVDPDQMRHQHYETQVPFDTTLETLKNLVVVEIVAGIERACRFDQVGEQPSDQPEMDYSKIALIFYCFLPESSSWRRLSGETDWLQAKQLFRSGPNSDRVKLMYGLEKQSEWVLLRKIEENFNLRRQSAEVRMTPQLSLESLTESLERSVEKKQHPYYQPSHNHKHNHRAGSGHGGGGGGSGGTAIPGYALSPSRAQSLPTLSRPSTNRSSAQQQNSALSSRINSAAPGTSRTGSAGSAKRGGGGVGGGAGAGSVMSIGIGEIVLTARTDRTDGGGAAGMDRNTARSARGGGVGGGGPGDSLWQASVGTVGTAPSTAMRNLQLGASRFEPPAPPGGAGPVFGGDSMTLFSETMSDTSGGAHSHNSFAGGRTGGRQGGTGYRRGGGAGGTGGPIGAYAQSSLLYPKRSVRLDRLQEEAQAAAPRQDAYAQELESRLFKTKF